ncbi:MAG: VWA domain-containing protein [Planctomycetes bacterium]|nr:VWA domain-containing protein [Planctomycetota bacterium]
MIFAVLSVLAPYALAASALLAIPIIVHLLKPRKVRQTPFSSLRWLHLTRQHLTRRIRWHQFLLFLLRAAFIVLLVLALARPIFSTGQEGKPAERFIVLDVSRSMKYKDGDRPSVMDNARELAAQLVRQALPEDRTALLLTSNRTDVLCPLGPDAEDCLAALSTVRAGNADTDLGSALPVIRSMLSGCRPGADVRIAFITDNYQRNWDQAAIATFLQDVPSPPQVKIIDVAPPHPHNAWIAGARFQGAADEASGQPARIIVQLGCSSDEAQERTLTLTDLSPLKDQTRNILLQPGRLTTVDFEVPAGFNVADKIARLQLTPSDRLPEDDQFWLPLAPRGTQVLVIEPESPRKDRYHPAFPLRTAIDVLGQEGMYAWQRVSKSHREVTPKDVAGAEVIVLADVPDVSEPVRHAIEERVRTGGGLAIFLGPHVQGSFYNTKLASALQPGKGLLPLPLKSAVPADNRLAPMTRVSWSHPLFASMLDPIVGDLGQVRFRSYYLFDDSPRGNVLAWIDDKSPALVEHALEAGKVLVVNTTPNADWSDLAGRASFVPLIDRMLAHLSGGGSRRQFRAGDEIALTIDKTDDAVRVTTPADASLVPTLKPAGERTMLRLPPQDEPGVYLVRSNDRTRPFVVQVGVGDSVLAPADAALLRQWWQPANLEIVRAESGSAGIAAERLPLWPLILAVASFLLLTETFIVTWLCPKATPAVAHGIVHRRGLLASSPKTASPEAR